MALEGRGLGFTERLKQVGWRGFVWLRLAVGKPRVYGGWQQQEEEEEGGGRGVDRRDARYDRY